MFGSEDFGFALKPPKAIPIGGDRLGQNLDGNCSLQIGVGGSIDLLAHPACADLGDHVVGTESSPGLQ